MKFSLATLGGIAWLLFAQAAFAVGRDRLSYTGVEVAFGRVDFANSTALGDRLEFGASLELARPLFLSAAYSVTEPADAQPTAFQFSGQSTVTRVDLGCHLEITPAADFVPSISWVEIGTEIPDGYLPFYVPPQEETGWAARTAFRTLFVPWLEVDAFIDMMFIPDNVIQTGAVAATFYPFRHIGVGVGYEASEGNHTFSARARIVR